MYIRKKLSVAVAALIVSTQLGSTWGVAAPSSSQIAELQDHLIKQDYAALAALLDSSPELLAEQSSLAMALRGFLNDYSTGTFTAFSTADLTRLETLMADACRSAQKSDDAEGCTLY